MIAEILMLCRTTVSVLEFSFLIIFHGDKYKRCIEPDMSKKLRNGSEPWSRKTFSVQLVRRQKVRKRELTRFRCLQK